MLVALSALGVADVFSANVSGLTFMALSVRETGKLLKNSSSEASYWCERMALHRFTCFSIASKYLPLITAR